jgi:hypothetical protein
MHASKRMLASLTALAAASLALVLIPTGSAATLRVAGTPATYIDPAGDAKAAPDVTKVDLDLDAASGVLKIEIALAGTEELAANGIVVVVIDSDRNSGTGDKFGADYAVAIFGNGMAFLKWNGSEMAVFNHQPTLLARGPGKIFVGICSCDLGTQTFDFWVLGIRGDDVDLAPDSGEASYPVQENAVSIRSLLYIMTPLFPKAGKRFTLKIQGVRLEGSNELVLPDSLSCSAKLAGKAIKSSSTGACSWLLPKKARGKKLTVSVNVSYHGDSETFTQTFKVT